MLGDIIPGDLSSLGKGRKEIMGGREEGRQTDRQTFGLYIFKTRMAL